MYFPVYHFPCFPIVFILGVVCNLLPSLFKSTVMIDYQTIEIGQTLMCHIKKNKRSHKMDEFIDFNFIVTISIFCMVTEAPRLLHLVLA